MSNDKLGLKRNASHLFHGIDFQVGAGISLLLDYIKEFKKIKMEGSEDIILTLADGKKLYAQAKSVMVMGNQSSASKSLTGALITLGENAKNDDVFKLVYITNIANPLSSKLVSAFSFGGVYDFPILSSQDKKKIADKVGVDFPIQEFQIQILEFFGEGKSKFNKIKSKISEFLQDAIGDASYSERLLDSWFTTFMANGADKPTECRDFILQKKQVVFPVIAVVIDPPIGELEFSKVCDYENYEEVAQEFRNTIS